MPERRELVHYAREQYVMSLRQACPLFSMSTSVFYYQAKRKEEDFLIIDQLTMFKMFIFSSF